MNITLTLTLDEDTLTLLKKVLGVSLPTVTAPSVAAVPKNVPEYKHAKWQHTFLRLGTGQSVKYDNANIGAVRSAAVYWNRKYGSLIGMHIRVSKRVDGSIVCIKETV